jgi:hypothetical protein
VGQTINLNGIEIFREFKYHLNDKNESEYNIKLKSEYLKKHFVLKSLKYYLIFSLFYFYSVNLISYRDVRNPFINNQKIH